MKRTYNPELNFLVFNRREWEFWKSILGVGEAELNAAEKRDDGFVKTFCGLNYFLTKNLKSPQKLNSEE